jgi:Transposase, Mutator family
MLEPDIEIAAISGEASVPSSRRHLQRSAARVSCSRSPRRGSASSSARSRVRSRPPGGDDAGRIELKGHTNVVALGVTTDGAKIPLGLWEGSSENAAVATALLSVLVARGLDPEQGMPFVVDGAQALRKAIRSVFGEAPVQRCIRHKEHNVLGASTRA